MVKQFMIFGGGVPVRLVRVPENEIEQQLADGERYEPYDPEAHGVPGADLMGA